MSLLDPTKLANTEECEKHTYTLDDAVKIVKLLQEPLKKVEIAISIGGSLAYRGTSTKDADIILYPYAPEQFLNIDNIVFLLQGLGFYINGLGGSGNFTDVLVADYNGMRVDFIILKR